MTAPPVALERCSPLPEISATDSESTIIIQLIGLYDVCSFRHDKLIEYYQLEEKGSK